MATFSLTRGFAWQALYFVTGGGKSKIIKVSGFLGVQVNTARVLHVLAAAFLHVSKFREIFQGRKSSGSKNDRSIHSESDCHHGSEAV